MSKLRMFVSHKLFKFGLSLMIVVVSYFIWTHGRLLPGQFEKEVLTAQASSPLPPEWLKRYFGRDYCLRLDYCGPDADPDRDGMSNYEEFLYFTNPTDPDTDGDGTADGQELKNLTNPLGVGQATSARDINSLSEYNPFADQLTQEGLEAIQKGEVTTFEQINEAAAKIANMPDLDTIVPFIVSQENNQRAVDRYVNQLTGATETYRNNQYVISVGPRAIDSTDIVQLGGFIEVTNIYATTLVHTEVPSDLFSFHKSLYGSLMLQSFLANIQKEYVEGEVSEADTQNRIKIYTVYYTRYLQDMNNAVVEIQKKYTFPFIINEEGQQL